PGVWVADIPEALEAPGDAHFIGLARQYAFVLFLRTQAIAQTSQHSACREREESALHVAWGFQLYPIGNQLVPCVVFEERVLHLGGDCFERGGQPPSKPLATEMYSLGPELVA